MLHQIRALQILVNHPKICKLSTLAKICLKNIASVKEMVIQRKMILKHRFLGECFKISSNSVEVRKLLINKLATMQMILVEYRALMLPIPVLRNLWFMPLQQIMADHQILQLWENQLYQFKMELVCAPQVMS